MKNFMLKGVKNDDIKSDATNDISADIVKADAGGDVKVAATTNINTDAADSVASRAVTDAGAVNEPHIAFAKGPEAPVDYDNNCAGLKSYLSTLPKLKYKISLLATMISYYREAIKPKTSDELLEKMHAEYQSASDAYARKEDKIYALFCLLKDEDERDVISERYLYGHKWCTVARNLGINKATVQSICDKALENLSKTIKVYYKDTFARILGGGAV